MQKKERKCPFCSALTISKRAGFLDSEGMLLKILWRFRSRPSFFLRCREKDHWTSECCIKTNVIYIVVGGGGGVVVVVEKISLYANRKRAYFSQTVNLTA